MGDGIMALFGAPLAHEDHAVRACYAALAYAGAMRRYAAEVRRTHGVRLHMRVGLNAGEVVVRAIGNDLHMDYSAVGQTTHLAARMEQMAMPGAILITPAVLGLVEGFVQIKALGAMPVRGLRDPLEVYELTGPVWCSARLQAAAARGLTRFVGRQPELEALAAGPSAGVCRARPSGGPRRGGGGGQVSVGVRGGALASYAGLAGARERLSVVWQGHAVFSRH